MLTRAKFDLAIITFVDSKVGMHFTQQGVGEEGSQF